MIVGSRVHVEDMDVVKYETVWNDEIINFFSNHRVKDIKTVPGTGYIVIATEFFKKIMNTEQKTIRFTNIQFNSFILIDDNLSKTTVCFEYNYKSELFVISTVKSDHTLVVHASMHAKIIDNEEIVEVFSLPNHCEEIECGKSFYETLANKYTNEFSMLQRVYQDGTDLYSILDYGSMPDVVSYLRLIAMLDVSTHIGMIKLSLEERLAGLVFKSIGECRFNSSFFNVTKEDLKDVRVCMSLYKEGSYSDIKLFSKQGLLCELLHCETVLGNNHIPTSFIDKWIVPSVQGEEFLPKDVYQNIYYASKFNIQNFHNSLDFDNRKPFVMVCEEENEFSAYLRTLRSEYPDWNILVVYTSKVIDIMSIKMPINEPEIKINDTGNILVRKLVHYNPATSSMVLKDDGVYVITGGLGFVGRNLAKTIYENGGKNIILLSSTRDSLPADWNFDFKPVVVKCDVSDQIEVKQFFSSLTQPVKGIVHAAGVLSDKTLPNLTNEDWEKVFSSKVNGARNIDNAIQELQITPTFVVFCSSIASSFGAAGQANYAAANGALDALARKRENYFSIQWGAWLGGGMADDITIQRSSRMGIIGLTCENACKQFHRVINNPEKIVMVCPLHLEKLPASTYFSEISTNTVSNIQKNVNDILRNLTSEEERLNWVREKMNQICSMLGVDIPDETAPWSEIGLDSLSMVEFRNEISKTFQGILLSDTLLFDYPNVKSLSLFILSRFGDIKSTRKKERQKRGVPFEPIAVIAIGCDFPMNINSPELLFTFLEKGGDAMTDVPPDRFDPNNHPQMYVRRGAFLSSMHDFNNDLFKISDAEAKLMDPQQRKCLEMTSTLLYQLGSKTNEKLNDTGVFVANMTYEHQSLTEDGKFSPYSGTGVSPAILSNRISYTYNMQGPSMTVDTACSSSLVAIDLGCKALMAGDCLQAVVLGVNFLGGHGYEGECAANMLSVNGRCATFSDKADGYARGEGCCGMIIKKLQHALEDDDRVIAVIKSTSVNQDGKSANLTSPNGPSQEKCIQQALTRADLTVDDIDFIEAHGTGTPLGDPMEIQALANVFDERQLPLPITAIKAHFGHTEGAAGMIGVIKAIKCMQKRKIPKNIHCNTLNSRIVPFVENKKIIIINQDGYELQQNKSVYYAGISSFGFGGTNAHIIIGLRK